jgi:hypothetical protein
LDSIVTCNESWVHYVTPESKRASKQCKPPILHPPKKAKAIFFSGEDHGCCVLGFQGYHSPGLTHCSKTINAQYYSTLLNENVKPTIRSKRRKGRIQFSSSKTILALTQRLNDGNSTETEVECPASSTVQSILSSI